MNKRTARTKADAAYGRLRLEKARSLQQQAQHLVTLLEPGQDGSAAVTLMVSAAIAYSDAVTAIKAGTINQKDHARVVDLVRDVMGNALPRSKETALKRLLSRKDEAQYGVRTIAPETTKQLLHDLDDFAQWVEDLL